MRKLLQLGVVLAVVASGFLVGHAADAVLGSPVTVIPCNAPVGTGYLIDSNANVSPGSLGVQVPNAVPVLGGTQLVGDEGVCADLYRTLVFEGTAVISDGVNFAGSGNGTGAISGSYVFGSAGQPGLNSAAGLPGICVMVDWQNNDVAAVSPAPTVTNCTFGVTNGAYGGPTQQTPVIKQAFADAANGGEPQPGGNPVGNLLHWDPANQPSCFDSNGSGIATFTAKDAVSGATEVWSSNYTWANSLNNLRGALTGTRNGNAIGGGPFTFDAKIEAHADPVAAIQDLGTTTRTNVFDASDAGCLEKNAVVLSGGLAQTTNNQGIGLNHILVAGTATWKLVTPES